MKFEFDERKSIINLEKHGISLKEARLLWVVPHVEISARSIDEPRYMLIGMIMEKFYSCIFTRRDGAIRLISVRRSRKQEEAIYHEYI